MRAVRQTEAIELVLNARLQDGQEQPIQLLHVLELIRAGRSWGHWKCLFYEVIAIYGPKLPLMAAVR
jgi:hypothetical protein